MEKIAPEDPTAALRRAIDLMGGSTEAVRKLNARGHEITGPATLYQWKKSRVPADYCPDIEALTGVRCEALRPDVAWVVLRRRSATKPTAAEA